MDTSLAVYKLRVLDASVQWLLACDAFMRKRGDDNGHFDRCGEELVRAIRAMRRQSRKEGRELRKKMGWGDAKMAKSPTGIIPEELMRPGKLSEVMAFLSTLPVHGDDKVDLFVGWAKMVGVKVNASQRQKVRMTGSDRSQFPSL